MWQAERRRELKEIMPHGRPGSKWNNETDVGDTGQEGVDWVRLLPGGDNNRNVVDMMTKIQVQKTAGNVLADSVSISF